jgi:hypothetical protein
VRVSAPGRKRLGRSPSRSKGDARVQDDGVLAGGEEVVAHEIALVHALEDQLPPAEGLLRAGRAGRAGVAALLEARQVASTERPAAVVVFATRLVLAARLVREEVVGSFDVADQTSVITPTPARTSCSRNSSPKALP